MYDESQSEALCPPSDAAPLSRPDDAPVTDPLSFAAARIARREQADAERREQLALFLAKLRAALRQRGHGAEFLEQLHMDSLLALYHRHLVEEEDERPHLRKLMEEPPRRAA